MLIIWRNLSWFFPPGSYFTDVELQLLQMRSSTVSKYTQVKLLHSNVSAVGLKGCSFGMETSLLWWMRSLGGLFPTDHCF